MTDPSLPSLPSLVASARAVFGVVLGATLQPGGLLSWSGVPLSEQAFAREVVRLSAVVISLLHGDSRAHTLPPSPSLDYLASAFRDPRVVQQIISLARRVDAARGVASSRSETMH